MIPPKIDDWIKTVKQIEKKGWLIKTANIKTGKDIYMITGDGLDAYELVCHLIGESKLYEGPPTTIKSIDKDSKPVKKLYNDNIVVKQFDYSTHLTPKGADFMFLLLLCDDIPVENIEKIQNEINQRKKKEIEKSKPKGKKKPKVNKVAEISMKVIEGTNKVGKMMGDMSKAMDKMGTSMGGDFGGKKKGRKKGNSYGDEYSDLGKKMMGNGKF